MADTAAFFAKKKTKKKKFKSFNANKIDASQISTDVHVDAPEISAEEVVAAGLGGLSVASRSLAPASTSSRMPVSSSTRHLSTIPLRSSASAGTMSCSPRT